MASSAPFAANQLSSTSKARRKEVVSRLCFFLGYPVDMWMGRGSPVTSSASCLDDNMWNCSWLAKMDAASDEDVGHWKGFQDGRVVFVCCCLFCLGRVGWGGGYKNVFSGIGFQGFGAGAWERFSRWVFEGLGWGEGGGGVIYTVTRAAVPWAPPLPCRQPGALLLQVSTSQPLVTMLKALSKIGAGTTIEIGHLGYMCLSPAKSY